MFSRLRWDRSPYSIRRAVPSDACHLKNVVERSATGRGSAFPKSAISQLHHELSAESPYTTYVALRPGGKDAIAYMQMTCPTKSDAVFEQAEICHLYVHADFARKGPGKALVSKALRLIDKVNASTTTLAFGDAADFYRKFGFVDTAKTRNGDVKMDRPPARALGTRRRVSCSVM